MNDTGRISLEQPRIDMRSETRAAVADICGRMLAEYGIVLTFADVFSIATAIDRQMRLVIANARAWTPEQLKEEMEREPAAIC